MFPRISLRSQLNLLAAVFAALIIAAIPVTVTFAQAYNYNQINYRSPGGMNYATNYQYQQQYYQPQHYTYQQPNYQLYWCNGYYSYSPCPQQYHYPQYQYPQYQYPQQQQYYYPNYYNSYWYNYSYSYDYGYGWDWGWYW
jgi:hypothetical protein